ncbi:MAG: CapA family protein [Bifidobacteriaceae bacterium]|jgi:poly-gamma-glutamate synthesis protein (capsule biosynthesis protein)|nr:CapA family protein [Bifidobacteriaceae bacterium]
MSPIPRGLLVLAAALVAGLGLGAALAAYSNHLHDAAASSAVSATGSAVVTTTAAPWVDPVAPPQPSEELTVTVAFGGDMLMHQPVNSSAAAAASQAGASGYEYSPLLAGVDRWIAGADLAICQLEVPLTPPGQAPSGYPVFGAPTELARDLAEQGWDGCTTASNHALDRGWTGLSHTIETLRDAGLGYSGTARDAADAELPQLYRLSAGGQTLTIAHIAATYGVNGLPLPADQPWSVNTPIDTARMITQAEAARAAGADIVLATIHDGVEYRTTPTPEQRGLVARLAESGQIDAVIGDHPHVAEPIELVSGGVSGDGMWTIYSLGNFISNQTDAVVGPNTDTGVVAYLTITKDAGGAAVTGMTWAGVTVDTAHGHRVHMLEDSVAAGGELGQIGAAGVSLRYERLRAIMGDAAEQLEPPKPAGVSLEVVPRG